MLSPRTRGSLSVFLANASHASYAAASPELRALHTYVIRLSDEILDWLDTHRAGEPRVVLIRSILREHIRRHARATRREKAADRGQADGQG